MPNHSPEYKAWKAMKARCYAPCHASLNYQKKGIEVCAKWRNDFDAFLKDMGPRPGRGYSLDRINNDGNYCKSNCRWATTSQQQRNKGNQLFLYQGKRITLKEISDKSGIKYTTLYQRVYRNELTIKQATSSDPFFRLVCIDGQEKTVTQWCKFYRRKVTTVLNRIHDGWDKSEAILKPTLPM